MDPRKTDPETVANLELITMEELHEVRRIWVFEKHEIEDSLPRSTGRKQAKTSPVALSRNTYYSARTMCGFSEKYAVTINCTSR